MSKTRVNNVSFLTFIIIDYFLTELCSQYWLDGTLLINNYYLLLTKKATLCKTNNKIKYNFDKLL